MSGTEPNCTRKRPDLMAPGACHGCTTYLRHLRLEPLRVPHRVAPGVSPVEMPGQLYLRPLRASASAASVAFALAAASAPAAAPPAGVAFALARSSAAASTRGQQAAAAGDRGGRPVAGRLRADARPRVPRPMTTIMPRATVTGKWCVWCKLQISRGRRRPPLPGQSGTSGSRFAGCCRSCGCPS